MTKVKLLVIHLCKITTHYCKCNVYFSFSSSTTWIKENAINLSQRNNYDKNKQTTKSRLKKLLYGELGQKKAKMRSRSGLRLSVLSWCFCEFSPSPYFKSQVCDSVCWGHFYNFLQVYMVRWVCLRRDSIPSGWFCSELDKTTVRAQHTTHEHLNIYIPLL